MNDKKINRIIYFVMLPFLIIALVLTTIIIFSAQKINLDNEISKIVTKDLEVCTDNKISVFNLIINKAEESLVTINSMVNSGELLSDKNILSYANAIDKTNICAYFYKNKETLESEKRSYYISGIAAEKINEAMDGKTAVTGIQKNIGTDEEFVEIYMPNIVNNEFKGIAIARIYMNRIFSGIEKTGFLENVAEVITDDYGKIIYESEESRELIDNNILDLKSDSRFENILKNNNEKVGFDERLGAYVVIKDMGINNWRFVSTVWPDDVRFTFTNIFKNIIIIGVSLIAFTLMYAVFLFSLILRQRKKAYNIERKYVMLEHFTDTILFEYDINKDVLDFTPNAKESLSLNKTRIRNVSKVTRFNTKLLYPDDLDNLKNLYNKEIENDNNVQIRLLLKSGEYGWFNCSIKVVKDKKGNLYKILGKLMDITDERARQLDLEEKANRDVLTGIYNKYGEKVIGNILKAVKVGTFMMIDLDDFKSVNDTYGHKAGDLALVKVADILKSVFRSADVVARTGGDEFIAFMKGVNNTNIAIERAKEILSEMEKPIFIEGVEVNISCSIGIAFSPSDGTTVSELYAAADRAMYQIKNRSKSSYAIYKHGADE